jgi:hypothetical protein
VIEVDAVAVPEMVGVTELRVAPVLGDVIDTVLDATETQEVPFPVYPALHAHVRDPGVLVQVALVSQPPFGVTVVHSSTSEQEVPPPDTL